jgi:Ca-activated chloride channel family protein
LRSVYENLGSRMEVLTRETEITALLAMLAAMLTLAAGVLSILWFRRLG